MGSLHAHERYYSECGKLDFEMSKSILLREATASTPVKKGNRWRVIAARPGQGSSGFWSEDVLREQGPKAFLPNAQSFINHDIDRNPKDLIGTFPEGLYWSEEDKALVGDLQVFSHWADFVEEIAPHVGMSLYARGELDEDGNVVTIFPHRQNGVDLVSQPGLEGSRIAEQLLESARSAESKEPSVNAAQEGKENMELEKKVDALADTVSKLAESINTLVSEKQIQAAEAAQVKADETVVAERVAAFAESVQAIDATEGLLPSQRATLLEAAKEGADIAPLIESAKKLADEAREAFTATEDAGAAGRFLGESAVKDATELGKVL